jgi:hypothetical protein
MGKKWRIAIEKDIRLPALVSVIKAAYLTVFVMLGYSYALSAGGRLVGWDILGKFFLRNRGLGKADVLANAQTHFKEFANMVRPLLDPHDDVRGTATDRFVFVCRCDADAPWGMIVFIRTSHLVHAALVPILETDSAAGRFVAFLKEGGCKLRANRCHFDGHERGVSPHRCLSPFRRIVPHVRRCYPIGSHRPDASFRLYPHALLTNTGIIDCKRTNF